jgi:tetratricopeptide (TPR) repeat protein
MTTSIKEKYFQKKSGTKSISAALDDIEAILGKLDGSPSPLAEKVLVTMDEIQFQMKSDQRDELEEIKIKTQLTFVSKKIRAMSKVFVKTIGGKRAFQEKRKSLGVSVKQEQWWWYLDEYLELKKKNEFKRLGIFGFVLIIVFVVMAVVYDQFIAPPPEVRARLEFETRIDNLIENGDYNAAISETNKALELAPEYYPLWIKKGVLAKVLGNEKVEQESYETALLYVENIEYFYYERGSVFMQFGLLDDLLSEVDNILAVNPQSAEAYLYRGLVQEVQGQNSEAYKSLEKASILAEDQNKAQLVATIRMRMAMIMQSVAIPTPEK